MSDEQTPEERVFRHRALEERAARCKAELEEACSALSINLTDAMGIAGLFHRWMAAETAANPKPKVWSLRKDETEDA